MNKHGHLKKLFITYFFMQLFSNICLQKSNCCKLENVSKETYTYEVAQFVASKLQNYLSCIFIIPNVIKNKPNHARVFT